MQGGGLQDPQALQNAAKLGLDFQQQVAQGLGLQDQRTGQINQARLTEAADFAFRVQDLSIERQNIAINKRIEEVEARGGDATQSRELLATPFEQRKVALQAVQLAGLSNEARLKFMSGEFDKSRIKSFAPRPNEEGGLSVPQIAADGSVTFIPIPGSVAETGAEKGARQVRERGEITRTKLQETRVSDITKELSTRNRDAARTLPRIQQALTLAQTADQGFTGAAKLKLAKLIPGIDVTDEGQLQSALLSLSLDQLQNFKGPTTDFEFGVTQSIVGGVGESKTANIARLNSLKRAAWFNQREFKQFRAFTRTDGDPDDFSFDFNEIIKTKKGDFTLQDLQDTAVNDNLSIQEVLRELNK